MRKILPFFNIITTIIFTTQLFAKECKVNELDRIEECSQCEKKIEEPAGFFEETIGSIIQFTTKSKENTKTLNTLKALEDFLLKENNTNICSNYSTVKERFVTLFQINLKNCSEGPKILNNNKVLCEWVFGKYIDSIENSFYATYATVDQKGIVREVPGAKERLESPMRAHLRWCNEIKKIYDYKIYVNCSTTENNLAELDNGRKIHEAIQRDLKSSENPPKSELTIEQQRRENLKEACKYFDNHPVTTISKDFYLQCI